MISEEVLYTIELAALMGIQGGTPEQKKPKGRWLLDPTNSRFYWEGETLPLEQLKPPSFLRDWRYDGAPPKPFKVASRDGGRTSRSANAKTALLYELDEYISRFKPSQGTKSDHYNPFGRFSTANATSFLPNPRQPGGKAAADTIVSSLASSDDTSFKRFVSAVKEAGVTASGYPKQIIVEGGQELDLVEETALGAVYAEGRLPVRQATRDLKRVRDPAELPLTVDVSEPIKIVPPTEITHEIMQAFEGEKRVKSQAQVMGTSAAKVAENAGYAPNEGAGWEWLHLIAHSMGGLETQGPQVAGNLVAGTSECNTQMIVVEEFIKDYISKWKGKAHLCVMAEMSDKKRHIGGIIRYHFYLSNKDGEPVEVYIWTFDALSRTNPMTMQNRALRTAGRETLKDGGLGKTRYEIGSNPTAATLGLNTEGEAQKLAQMVRNQAPHEVVEQLLASKAGFDGEVPDWMFGDIGEQAPVEVWNDYAALIGKAFNEDDRATMVAGAHVQLGSWVEGATTVDDARHALDRLINALKTAPNVVTRKELVEIIGESIPPYPEALHAWGRLVEQDFGAEDGKALFGAYVRQRVDRAEMETSGPRSKGASTTIFMELGEGADWGNIRTLGQTVFDQFGKEEAGATLRAFVQKRVSQAAMEGDVEAIADTLRKGAELLGEPPDTSALLEIGRHATLENIKALMQMIAGLYDEGIAGSVYHAFALKNVGQAAMGEDPTNLSQAATLLKEMPKLPELLEIGQDASWQNIEAIAKMVGNQYGENAANEVLHAFARKRIARATMTGDVPGLRKAADLLGQPPEMPALLEISQHADGAALQEIAKMAGDLYGEEAAKALIRTFALNRANRAMAQGNLQDLSSAFDLLDEPPEIPTLLEIGRQAYGTMIDVNELAERLGQKFGSGTKQVVIEGYSLQSLE